jgi:hypothetical protein
MTPACRAPTRFMRLTHPPSRTHARIEHTNISYRDSDVGSIAPGRVGIPTLRRIHVGEIHEFPYANQAIGASPEERRWGPSIRIFLIEKVMRINYVRKGGETPPLRRIYVGEIHEFPPPAIQAFPCKPQILCLFMS